ncbi:MAG: hypothetical protein ACR2I8_03940 [Steroidobacteraceae bacterium]
MNKPGLFTLACCAALVAGTATPASNPIAGGGSVTLESVPDPAPPLRTRRLVYACASADGAVFADRPCGVAAAVRELLVTQPPAASAAAVGSGAGPRAGHGASPARTLTPNDSRTPGSSSQPTLARDDARMRRREGGGTAPGRDPDAAQVAACERLEESLEDIDSRMRAGYSAREAAQLWNRWREAKSRLREAGC